MFSSYLGSHTSAAQDELASLAHKEPCIQRCSRPIKVDTPSQDHLERLRRAFRHACFCNVERYIHLVFQTAGAQRLGSSASEVMGKGA